MYKDLPVNLWAQVAQYLKWDPPRPGKSADWTEDLQQQDLVSLQRVNKVRVSCSFETINPARLTTLEAVWSRHTHLVPLSNRPGLWPLFTRHREAATERRPKSDTIPQDDTTQSREIAPSRSSLFSRSCRRGLRGHIYEFGRSTSLVSGKVGRMRVG